MQAERDKSRAQSSVNFPYFAAASKNQCWALKKKLPESQHKLLQAASIRAAGPLGHNFGSWRNKSLISSGPRGEKQFLLVAEEQMVGFARARVTSNHQ